jgi:DNA-binding MarR family transcriptional regulator
MVVCAFFHRQSTIYDHPFQVKPKYPNWLQRQSLLQIWERKGAPDVRLNILIDVIAEVGYIINTMNENNRPKSLDNWSYQMKKLQELIHELQRCCEDKKLYESNRFGIPYSEIRVLMLFRNEKYLTVKGASDSLDVAKSRVTKLINSMYERGLISRMADPGDSRVKLLSLTTKGKQIAAAVEDFQNEIQAQILGRLEPEERSKVISGLELLRAAMQEVRERLEQPESRAICPTHHMQSEKGT